MDGTPMTATVRPASAEQAEVWMAVQREPETDRYNIPLDLEFAPDVNLTALREALRDLVAHHPALRCAFVTSGGQLQQVVADEVRVPFAHSKVDGPYDRASALAWATDVAARPFELASGPPVRADLLSAADGALLVLTVHHIVSDGWSQQLVMRDLLGAYAKHVDGSGLELVPRAGPPATLADGDARSIAYWHGLLQDSPTVLAPVPDRVREGSAPGLPGHAEYALAAATLADVARLAQSAATSPARVVLAAWLTLLHGWSGSSEGTSGMVFAGRTDEEQHDEVGLFARVLPVRSQVDFTESFRSLLHRVGGQVLDSLDYSDITSMQLRELRALHSDGGLIDPCVFVHAPAIEGTWSVAGSTTRAVAHETASAKYDFSLLVNEGTGGTSLRLDFDSFVYSPGTAKAFLAELAALIAAGAAAPDLTCGELLSGCDEVAPPLLPAEVAGPDELLPELVLRQADLAPHAPAVTHGDETISYGELLDRASMMAHWLRAQGVDREDVVALLLSPGIDAVVLWLATLLAGGAYLPLDPAYPDAQLQLVLSDARPALLLAQDDIAHRVALDGVPTVLLGEALVASATHSRVPPQVELTAEMAFNVLYTSGSTGRPKGVVLPHGGIVRLFHRSDFQTIDSSDVLPQLSPLNFDGATFEVWGSLVHGAHLVVVDKATALSPTELRAAVRQHGMTILVITTPLFNRIVEDAPDLLQGLRWLYLGGEIISIPHVLRGLRWCGPGVLQHSYGPTENSFTSTWLSIKEVPDKTRTLPIGRCVPGTTAHVVLHGTTLPAPTGVPGELLLGGLGVARGYLGNARETARRYIPNPFTAVPGARAYRTGDRVRWLPGGLLEFIGRDDNQVKIRSQRVELGEVESALASHPGVQAAFVTTTRSPAGEKEIAAYVVLTGFTQPADLRRHARAVLPTFAVPRWIVPLDSLPLTVNHKIDRRKLPDPRAVDVNTHTAADVAEALGLIVPAKDTPAPTVRASATSALAEAMSSTVTSVGLTTAVRDAWAAVIDSVDFGSDENFFDVGGHSLLLVKLQEALRARTGTAVPIRELLRQTTVRAQVALLGGPFVVETPSTATVGGVTETPPTPNAPSIFAPVPRPESADALDSRTARVVALSARTDEALVQVQNRLGDWLRDHPDADLANLAHTLHKGREHLAVRTALVVPDTTLLAVLLDQPDASARAVHQVSGLSGSGTASVALVVGPGRGVVAGSAAALYWDFPVVRAFLDEADTRLYGVLKQSLVRHLTVPSRPGSRVPGGLATVSALVLQLGVAEQLAAWGMVPDLVVALDDGGSCGTGVAAALVTAGGLDLKAAADYLLHRSASWDPLLAPSARPIWLGGRLVLAGERLALPAHTDPTPTPVRDDAAPGHALSAASAAVGARAWVVLDLGGDIANVGASLDDATVVAPLLSGAGPDYGLLSAAASLWCAGQDLDLTADGTGRRIRLPGYPFARDRALAAQRALDRSETT